MKMKATLKYLLHDYKNVLFTMYLCVYAIAILIQIGTNFLVNSCFGGFEYISIITVFVLGLSSFKPYFKLFSANGASRKTLFCTATAALGITAVTMALIDTLNMLLLSHFGDYQSMFVQFYYRTISGASFGSQAMPYTFQMLTQQFMWSIFAYFLFAMVGFLITTLYYRMNKGLKIAVSIGVPILYFYVLPILDQNLWGGRLSHTIQCFLNFAWGFSDGYNSYIGMASMFIFAAVAAALAWLLVRRAGVKQ